MTIIAISVSLIMTNEGKPIAPELPGLMKQLSTRGFSFFIQNDSDIRGLASIMEESPFSLDSEAYKIKSCSPSKPIAISDDIRQSQMFVASLKPTEEKLIQASPSEPVLDFLRGILQGKNEHNTSVLSPLIEEDDKVEDLPDTGIRRTEEAYRKPLKKRNVNWRSCFQYVIQPRLLLALFILALTLTAALLVAYPPAGTAAVIGAGKSSLGIALSMSSLNSAAFACVIGLLMLAVCLVVIGLLYLVLVCCRQRQQSLYIKNMSNSSSQEISPSSVNRPKSSIELIPLTPTYTARTGTTTPLPSLLELDPTSENIPKIFSET